MPEDLRYPCIPRTVTKLWHIRTLTKMESTSSRSERRDQRLHPLTTATLVQGKRQLRFGEESPPTSSQISTSARSGTHQTRWPLALLLVRADIARAHVQLNLEELRWQY